MKASIMILENMLWGVLTQSLFRQKNTLLIKSVCVLQIEMQLGNNLFFNEKYFFPIRLLLILYCKTTKENLIESNYKN